MIFVNNVKDDEKISKKVYLDFLKCLAPLAPFISEELFQIVNNSQFSKENSIHLQDFPKYNSDLEIDTEINLPIQINGKLISVIKVKKDVTENEVLEVAKGNEKVSKMLENIQIKKVVFVPGKILSLII
jgi:leucyl-tRNA synthetase